MVALIQRPAEPREFADDEAVAALEGAREFVEPPAVEAALGLDQTTRSAARSSCCRPGGHPSEPR